MTVAVTKKELRDYLRPALKRRSFRFGRLYCGVPERTVQDLRLARAFGNIRERPEGFMRETNSSRPEVARPITAIFSGMKEVEHMCGVAGAATPRALFAQAMEEVRHVLIGVGVHASWGRPSSTGLMLNSAQVNGLPLYIYLGESFGGRIGQGRVNISPDGTGSVELDATQNAARLMQVMDYWLADTHRPPAHLELMKVLLARVDRAYMRRRLPAMLSQRSISGDSLPVQFALEVSCLRLMMNRLGRIADQSATPREFLLKALNAHMDSALTHEIGHFEEGIATSPLPLNVPTRETIAYLLQAVYADPADAFRMMMLRGFDITDMMPGMDRSMREKGAEAFCLTRGYLRGWAKRMLGGIFAEIRRLKGGEFAFNGAKVGHAGTSDYLTEKDMPLVEIALCNPNRRMDPKAIQLPDAESA